MPLFYEKNGKIIFFGLTIGDSFADLEKAVKGCGKSYTRSGSIINVLNCKISNNLSVVTLGFRFNQEEKIESVSLKGFLMTPTEADRLYSFLTDMFNKDHFTAELLHRTGNNLLVSTFYNDNIRVSISRYKDFGIKGKDSVSLSAFSSIPKCNNDNVVRPATKVALSIQNKSTIWCIVALAIVVIVTAFYIGRLSYSNSVSKTNGLYSTDPHVDNETNKNSVYICTSSNAKKYHNTRDCRWLENCSGEIKEVSLSAAEAQGKSPCKGCY